MSKKSHDRVREHRKTFWFSCHIKTAEERAEENLCRGKNAYSYYFGLQKVKDNMEWEEYKAKPHDMWYAWCGLC